jgi:hypothetical protein
LGGGAGAGAHHFSKEHGEAILQHARTSGVPVKAEYDDPHQQQGLNKLKELGLAPLNVGQNAPPSSVNIKPRF